MQMLHAAIQSRTKIERTFVLPPWRIRPLIAIQSANKTRRTCALHKSVIRKVTATAFVLRTQRISVWRRCAEATLVLGIKRNRWIFPDHNNNPKGHQMKLRIKILFIGVYIFATLSFANAAQCGLTGFLCQVHWRTLLHSFCLFQDGWLRVDRRGCRWSVAQWNLH
jgi:hypothetical protein